MRLFATLTLVAGLLAATGCNRSSDRTPVAGTVTLDGKPLVGATLFFTPSGQTQATGGSAVTGPDGKYAVLGPQGQKGLKTGTYRVAVSLRLRKDGTPPPPGVPPIESDARETLPARYSDPERSILTITVDSEKPYDIALSMKKK